MKFKVGQKVMGTKALYDSLGDSRFAGDQLPKGATGTIHEINETESDWKYSVMFSVIGPKGNKRVERSVTNNYMEEHLQLAISEQLDLI
jgi:hypothetical protein